MAAMMIPYHCRAGINTNIFPSMGSYERSGGRGGDRDGARFESRGGRGGYGGGRDMRPGDWNCEECKAHNFSRRDTCFKCEAPKPEGLESGGGGGGEYQRPQRREYEKREGEWDCPSCGINNFSRRTECFKCNTPKEGGGGGGGGDGGGYQQRERRRSPERREGDWECVSCGKNNFARNTDCFKCSKPKSG